MENEKQDLFDQIKSTLNAAGGAARQGLDKAGKKSGEALEIAKLRWKLSQLRGETRHLYCELGRSLYLEHSADEKAPIRPEELYAELDKKHVEMELIKRELQLKRGESPCPNEACTSTVRPDDAYCRKCGEKLHRKQP